MMLMLFLLAGWVFASGIVYKLLAIAVFEKPEDEDTLIGCTILAPITLPVIVCAMVGIGLFRLGCYLVKLLPRGVGE